MESFGGDETLIHHPRSVANGGEAASSIAPHPGPPQG
jgi:hypothetical protein